MLELWLWSDHEMVIVFLDFLFLGSAKTWKYMSFLVAIPGVIFCMVNAYKGEMEHKAHFAAHKPEFHAYTHLRIRTKSFPWGDGNHSLFHNVESNALPEGYEEE
eukprot:XP_790224.3 PREDICTED: cytochrome c oxidase subunit 6A, mitochondrial [Strongylocentrotus purpuratus]